MTTTNFIQTICEQYNESDLARAILESFDYFDTFEDFKNHISDVCRYGCVSGVSGYIYYSETSRFFKEHADEIRALVITRAEEFGESCLEMVYGFESLKDYSIDEIGRAIFGAYDEDLYFIYNSLVWFAVEDVCYFASEIAEVEEEEEEEEDCNA